MSGKKLLRSLYLLGGLMMAGNGLTGAEPTHRNVDGARIPFDESAFNVLWEGDTTWIVFGDAIFRDRGQAREMAQVAAVAQMRNLLLMRTFVPGRMVRIPGGGWRPTGNSIRGGVALRGGAVEPRVIQLPDGRWRGVCMFQVNKVTYSLDYIRRNAQLK